MSLYIKRGCCTSETLKFPTPDRSNLPARTFQGLDRQGQEQGQGPSLQGPGQGQPGQGLKIGP